MEGAVWVQNEAASLSNWSVEEAVRKVVENRLCSQNSARASRNHILYYLLWIRGAQIVVKVHSIGLLKNKYP